MKWIIQFVLGQFAKRGSKKGVAQLLKVDDPIVRSNIERITKILQDGGVDINKLKSTEDVLKHMNIHKSLMTQKLQQEAKGLGLGQGIKSLGKKKVDLSKYTDEDLNALVAEDKKILAEANKLSEAGTNYGRVTEIEARRKEIKEILEAAQAVPESGYGNIKADVALQKQDPFQGWTPKVIEGGGTSPDDFLKLKQDTFRRLMMNTDDDVQAFTKRVINNKQDVKFEKLTKDQKKNMLNMIEDRIRLGNRKFMDEYKDLDVGFDPEDFASGGVAGQLHLNRPGYGKGKGVDLDRRMVLKGLGALAVLPVVGKFFKWAKPLAKRDIRVKMKPDMDWSYEGPESGWEGGTWLNLDFVPLTKKGTKILDDLAKNKKIDKSIHGKETYYGVGNSEDGLIAVEDIKKMKGDMELETSVSNKVKGSIKQKEGEKLYQSDKIPYETTKVYSGKDIKAKKILKESSDLATDSPYHDNVFQDEFTEEIINTLGSRVKKASGGRVSYTKGGLAHVLGV